MPRTVRVAGAAMLLIALAACTDSEPAASNPPTSSSPATTRPAQPVDDETRGRFAALERRFDARLGVFAVDTGSGRELGFRADERFAFASTFKALATAAILRRTGELDRELRFDRGDLLAHAPIAEKHVDAGHMTLLEAMDAAVRYSDNTAGNLLLKELDGPRGLTTALREIGDRTTVSARFEPELNDVRRGDRRDTSTPKALARTLRAFAVDDVLPSDRRELLVRMLRRNTTGDDVIRAGTPKGWRVGDKTGTAAYGGRNDIAVVWPPGRAPIVLAVLTDHESPDAEHDDALLARAADVVFDALG